MGRGLIVLLLFFVAVDVGAEASRLEIIELRHRAAEELVPLVKPFLDPAGSVTGTGFRLIVRSTPENIEELRGLVREFDVGAKRLRITVRQDAREESRESGARVQGEIPIGERGRVRIGEPDREGGSIELHERRRTEDAPMSHSVQVVEGQWAAIATGQSVPIRQPDHRYGGVRHDYVEVSSGFEVLPRVNGDRVHLSIRPRRMAREGREIEVQRLDTHVSGRLGDWIELGGVFSESRGTRSGTLSESQREARSESGIQVKVELIP